MKLTQPIHSIHTEGNASRQAHTNLPQGTYERELGREGFFGPASQMYHRHPPTDWLRWEGPLKPRAFDLNEQAESDSPLTAEPFLSNAQVRLCYWQLGSAMQHLVRNADGDQLLFVHQGSGELYCDYGHLSFVTGDYIVLPRSCMWRIEPKDTIKLLMIEATGSAYQLPNKGIVGQHAIFDPAMLDMPRINENFLAQQDEETWKVEIKHRNQLSSVTYPFNPLDAIGWSGDLAPVRINVRDIRPLMSHRFHLPPSAHTTFLAQGFVVCTFVPRPFETDEDALKVPFFHNNDDYDEVIFYHAGDFFSRDNIGPGMVTFHPAGFTHGPHPGAQKHMFKQIKPATDEYAVMIDTRQPLEPGEPALRGEWVDYADSWKQKT